MVTVVAVMQTLGGTASPAIGDSFRRRCKSALTHPVTMVALAVLLVNDLVLKALWPHPWTTGKLSDLAWIVFAPSLLVYVLSFAVRGDVRAQRAAFIAAFVGLPLLYATFNTFASLHDLILRGFSLVTGATVQPGQLAHRHPLHRLQSQDAGLCTRLQSFKLAVSSHRVFNIVGYASVSRQAIGVQENWDSSGRL